MKRPAFSLGVLIATAALLTGCVTQRTLRDADERMVSGCTLVGDFVGSSGWGGNAGGIEDAKNSAAGKAEKKGATHMVWGSSSGGGIGTVSGRAYKCPDAPK